MTAEASGLNAGRKIADLRRLQNGWRNGDGIAFDADYLAWLSEAFSRMYPADAPTPTICPTTYGFVSAEWSFPSAEVSLEIDPETRLGELVWADTRTQNSGKVFFDMSEAEGWTRLANYLAKVAGADE
ncbi:MAG: hypothetical protein OXL37_02810 [Chloroflexota bacterium]|nr:hypothetical protein [Chloroflexota bacterium]MDE2961916.1 hypothetical protein [Chloroflexota bacterium]